MTVYTRRDRRVQFGNTFQTQVPSPRKRTGIALEIYRALEGHSAEESRDNEPPSTNSDHGWDSHGASYQLAGGWKARFYGADARSSGRNSP